MWRTVLHPPLRVVSGPRHPSSPRRGRCPRWQCSDPAPEAPRSFRARSFFWPPVAVVGRLSFPARAPPRRPCRTSRGARVMVFPVQDSQGVGPGTDAELAFALSQRGSEVDWVFADAMGRALQASPGMETRLDGLPVAIFLQVEVRRVGDPLYGYLRRIGALVDSEVALIPVLVRRHPGSAESPGTVEISTAVISVRTGQVLWFGSAEGEPGGVDDPRALASAADALAVRLLSLLACEGRPYTGFPLRTDPRAHGDPHHRHPRRRHRARGHGVRTQDPRGRRRSARLRRAARRRERARGPERSTSRRYSREHQTQRARAQRSAHHAVGERVPFGQRHAEEGVRPLRQRPPGAHHRAGWPLPGHRSGAHP